MAGILHCPGFVIRELFLFLGNGRQRSVEFVVLLFQVCQKLRVSVSGSLEFRQPGAEFENLGGQFFLPFKFLSEAVVLSGAGWRRDRLFRLDGQGQILAAKIVDGSLLNHGGRSGGDDDGRRDNRGLELGPGHGFECGLSERQGNGGGGRCRSTIV